MCRGCKHLGDGWRAPKRQWDGPIMQHESIDGLTWSDGPGIGVGTRAPSGGSWRAAVLDV